MIAETGAFFLRFLIVNDLNSDHQPPPANIADALVLFGPLRGFLENIIANLTRVFAVFRFDQIKGRQTCGYAELIAAKRRTMRARLPGHDALPSDERSERHSAGNTLRGAKNVRLDSGIFAGPPLPGSSHTRLHFIHNPHDAVRPADALQLLKKKIGRRNVAAFALNGLDNNSRHFLGIKKPLENLPFQLLQNFRAASLGGVAMRATVRVWVRNMLDTTQQRAKALTLCGFRRRQR